MWCAGGGWKAGSGTPNAFASFGGRRWCMGEGGLDVTEDNDVLDGLGVSIEDIH